MKVVITGGTGLIGRELQKKISDLGFQVVILSRKPQVSDIQGVSYALWDVEKGEIDKETVCNADYIIHLAGANIADKKWTNTQKKVIIDSRVKSADLIFKILKENKHQVKGFISASGISYYGTVTTDKVFIESDALGKDFLATVCDVWEKSTLQFQKIGIRTVCLRTGVVFAKEGSALQKMAKPVKIGIGSAIGSGKQIMPLIHIKDMAQLYVEAITNNNWNGIYNAVATSNTNKNVTEKIAKFLNKNLWLPNVPAFILKIIFGEMAIILLQGSAISNQKIKDLGFEFQYPSLEAILADTL